MLFLLFPNIKINNKFDLKLNIKIKYLQIFLLIKKIKHFKTKKVVKQT